MGAQSGSLKGWDLYGFMLSDYGLLWIMATNYGITAINGLLPYKGLLMYFTTQTRYDYLMGHFENVVREVCRRCLEELYLCYSKLL